jgi:hypothetical protein
MYQYPLRAHHGLWVNYSQPGNQSLIWTVTNLEALAILALFTGLIAFTQTRFWVISRSLLRRKLAPNLLDDPGNPRSLFHLSQGSAIKGLLNPGGDHYDLEFIPRWFGVSSITIGVAFAILGALIPYYLTGVGGLSPVRSAPDKYCTGDPSFREPGVDRFGISADAFYTQC